MRVEINKSLLLNLAGNDKHLLLSIVEDFSEDGVRLIAGMEGAISDGDVEKLNGHLHQLKGASGSLGMKSLYLSCLNMEKEAEEAVSIERVGVLRRQHEESVQLALSCLRG